MSVYKDAKKGTWFSKFRYKNWNGETKWVTKRGFATKREAIQWENEFRLKTAGDLDMTMKEFIETYKEERFLRIKESTASTKDYIFEDKILPFFGNMKLRDVTSADVIKWQNALLKYVNPKTGERYSKTYLKTLHNQLSAIFNYACRFYKLSNNPARQAGNIGNEDDVDIDFWTTGEYRKFSRAIMGKSQYYYAFEVLYWLGLREGEMLALTSEDIDFEEGTVNVNKTYQVIRGKEVVTSPKTKKGKRIVKMPENLTTELKLYLASLYDLKPGDRIFPLTKYGLSHVMDAGSKAAGVKRIRIHDLRHSHVSLLINMGYSPTAIADRVGHESIRITFRYAHLFPTVQNDMADQLSEMMEDEDDAGK